MSAPTSSQDQPAIQEHQGSSTVWTKVTGTACSLHLDDPWLDTLLLVAFLLRIIFWVYTGRVWEDALITTLHSENFYHGLGLTHFRIDDPKPLHGFTSPISVLIPLVADFVHVGWGLGFQKLISLLAGPVAVWFAYRVLREYLAPGNRAAAVLGAGYIAVEHHQILWGMAGMETQLATAILLSSVFFLLSGRFKACAITCGLSLLARPDFLLWVVIAGIAITFECHRGKNFRPLLQFVILVTMIYGPWLVFTTLYYGSPIPNTIIAKRLGYVGFWETPASFPARMIDAAVVSVIDIFAPLEPVFGGNGTGFLPLVPGYWMAVLCLVVIAAGFVVDVELRRWRFWPLYGFAAASTAFFTFRAPVIFGWYVIPLCALLAILLAKGVADLAGFLTNRRDTVFSWVVTALYLAGFAVVLPTTFRAERNIQQLVETNVRAAIGIYLSHTPVQTTIAGEPLGYIGYYSRRTYYDYPGLCSRKVVNWLKDHEYPRVSKKFAVFAYLRPDYLVLRKPEYQTLLEQQDGRRLMADYHLEKEFTVSPTDRKQLFHPEKNVDLDYLLFARNTGTR